VFALMEMNASAESLLKHDSKSPDVRRAILMVLESQESLQPHVDRVLSALSDSDRELQSTAWWIASRHSEWGEQLAKRLDELLSSELTQAERNDVRDHLAKLSRSPAIQKLLAGRVVDTSAKLPARKLALSAMAQANPKEIPSAWLSAVAKALATPELSADAAICARSLRLPKTSPPELLAALTQLGNGEKEQRSVRLTALAAWPGEKRPLHADTFNVVLQSVPASQPTQDRGLAVEALTRSQVDADRLLQIAGALPAASPLELDRLLDLFMGTKDAEVGRKLFDVLADAKLRPFLRADIVERLAKNFDSAVETQSLALVKSLSADRETQLAKLEGLLKSLPAGDVHRGHTVFNNAKTSCIACHTIGYVGGKTGPDLTRIGQVRTRRDLLESIVFPSASFVRGYEPVVIVAIDGKTHNGLIKSESPDEITLTIGLNQEVRVPRSGIEEIQPSRVSVMPAGLDQQISRDELADLLAFLDACR